MKLQWLSFAVNSIPQYYRSMSLPQRSFSSSKRSYDLKVSGSYSQRRNAAARTILCLVWAVLVSQLIGASGLERVFVVLLPTLLAIFGRDLVDVLSAVGTALGAVVVAVAVVTTFSGWSIDGWWMALAGASGLTAWAMLSHSRDSFPSSRMPRVILIPNLIFAAVVLFFVVRFRQISDTNSRWWLLSQTSEDNAAWLNMIGRAASKTTISSMDVDNLGHTLPSLMWIIRRFGETVGGQSLLTSPIGNASHMAASILVLEALMISVCVFLSAAIAVLLCERREGVEGLLIPLIFAVPAALGSFLGGLVLARIGYLSAIVAMLGLQVIALLIIRLKPGPSRTLWVSLACLVTGLSWFPIIPIVAIGLIATCVHHAKATSHLGITLRALPMATCLLFFTLLVTHLLQLLVRYPDVDRLQGSMWIGSENLLTFFILLGLISLWIGLMDLDDHLRESILLYMSTAVGWLALVWINDLVRAGGPGHYGTTKLTFVVQYGLFPLLCSLTLIGFLKQVKSGSRLMTTTVLSALTCVAVTGVSNDPNGQWPRKPTVEEINQSPVIGILPLISKAAEGNASTVICLFVGDFEATGVWRGSYPCTRWGSSLSGVDRPSNEDFRQVILGAADPAIVLPKLIDRGFLDDAVIVTDKPERLKELDPWGIISAAEERGARLVAFRPTPQFIALPKVLPDKQ